jgi:ATP-dependent Clp protease ATP-binding subunit ClpA
VVDKFLIELQAQLEDKRVLLEVTDAARGWLAAGVTTCRWARGRWRG